MGKTRTVFTPRQVSQFSQLRSPPSRWRFPLLRFVAAKNWFGGPELGLGMYTTTNVGIEGSNPGRVGQKSWLARCPELAMDGGVGG